MMVFSIIHCYFDVNYRLFPAFCQMVEDPPSPSPSSYGNSQKNHHHLAVEKITMFLKMQIIIHHPQIRSFPQLCPINHQVSSSSEELSIYPTASSKITLNLICNGTSTICGCFLIYFFAVYTYVCVLYIYVHLL